MILHSLIPSSNPAPSEFDAAILAAARAAVVRAPRRRSRWRVPLAAAATMVLGVSLVSQLRDDAVPEAVRIGADAPLTRQAPVASSVAREAQTVEMLSAESVADMVAPSAPMPAPPSAEQASRAASPALKAEPDARRRQEQVAGAAMEKREAIERRERSAQAELRQATPQAHAFALAPAPLPAEASLDDVSIAARDLLLRLQAQDIDALTTRAPADLLSQVAGALPAFAGAHSAQVLPQSGGQAWRIAVVDEQGQTLGHADVVLAAQGWRLVALDPTPRAEP